MKAFYFLFFLSLTAHADPCQEVRGTLDIGSGSTKAMAALVDTCKKEIVRVVYENHVKIAFSEEIEKTTDQKFSPALLDEAAPKIKALVDAMKEKNAIHVAGVATAVFRKAANGGEAAATIAARIGAPVKVITQEEESQLGYLSALAVHHIPLPEQDDIAVWDIGGGSMQMRAVSKGDTKLYQGELASTTFKNRVLKEIQKKDPATNPSPNPLGKAWPRAVAMAEKEARKNVPAYFRQTKNGPKRWLGVGGVLTISVQDQITKKRASFTAEQLESRLKKRALLSDEKIESEYRITEVTNLALVLGYMKALKIKNVETEPASLNQGYLFLELFNPLKEILEEPAPEKAKPSKG